MMRGSPHASERKKRRRLLSCLRLLDFIRRYIYGDEKDAALRSLIKDHHISVRLRLKGVNLDVSLDEDPFLVHVSKSVLDLAPFLKTMPLIFLSSKNLSRL